MHSKRPAYERETRWQSPRLSWYKFCQERVPFINHAIIHPPVDHDRPPREVVDVCAHVEKETDAGIVVSGAKVVATGSVLTNYTFVAHHGLIPLQDKKFACVFMVPTNAPGLGRTRGWGEDGARVLPAQPPAALDYVGVIDAKPLLTQGVWDQVVERDALLSGRSFNSRPFCSRPASSPTASWI